MTITVSESTAKKVEQRAEAAGLSVDAYLDRLVREDEAWGEIATGFDERDDDFEAIRAAVSEGLQQAAQGEGIPAEEVFARAFRMKA
jgi:predicted transcriptional regulator